MIDRLYLKPLLPDEACSDLGGKYLGHKDFQHLIANDKDVYCSVTGKLLAKFRKKVLSNENIEVAFDSLKNAAPPQANRGMAAGWDEQAVIEYVKRCGGKGFVRNTPDSPRFKLIRSDGALSNTNYALPVNSGVVGYMDRSPRFPNCRLTAFTLKNYDLYKKAMPVIKSVDNLYRDLIPEKYALQKNEANKTSKDFVISDTSFTTLTVNVNWQTAVHQDTGDFEEGFGNLTAIRKGRYIGGYLVLPKWGVAFDLQNKDVLLMDVHQWHGNTPIRKIEKDAKRMSLVMYYRKNMIHCGSAEQELKNAEMKDYAKHGEVLPDRGSLCKARNVALDHAFSVDQICVQIDDDLKSIELYNLATKKIKKISLKDAIEVVISKMDDTPFKLGGSSTTNNPYFVHKEVTYTTFIIGSFSVYKPCKIRFDESMTLKEDYDITMQHITTHGGCVRVNSVLPKFIHYTNAGGAVDERSEKEEQKNISILKRKWGDSIKDNTKRPNEILLRPPRIKTS